ncbi:hypothetical protein SERLADRAFT_480452 [Serpula lacrymans var. lacrymans S7.9]|uniref:Thioesterase domain-containing protein n=1 Tax=Serpula lacrymans var. lacrymans (strain S7.9) TaxID=578457 RepID=F8PDD2_SERL9|nr:uncharacterized protein SERLADRAFT_480452 [Serpula lacrymans var. lacrymans S7.9]EGO18753.1 hypothetical protein SERLADRAFT_480452 [Serpula lacrymans var. lacrymans S7.9]
MQLLADYTLIDVIRCAMKVQPTKTLAEKVSSASYSPLDRLNADGEALLKLLDLGGEPLILMHGGSGNVLAFLPLQHLLRSSLWALQITPDTPTDSVKSMSRHYYEKIKAARPAGPYRLGGFSATSIVLFALAKLFEEGHDVVTQIIVFDHFPLLYTSPMFEPDEETVSLRSPGPDMIRHALSSVSGLYRADNAQRQKIAADFEDAVNGHDAPEYMTAWYNAFLRVAVTAYKFMFEILPTNEPYSLTLLRDAMVEWLKEVKAPVTTCLATRGIISTIPEDAKAGWEDLGTRKVFPQAELIEIEGTHFSIFESEVIVDLIDRYHQPQT